MMTHHNIFFYENVKHGRALAACKAISERIAARLANTQPHAPQTKQATAPASLLASFWTAPVILPRDGEVYRALYGSLR